jgi:hypothetical protein
MDHSSKLLHDLVNEYARSIGMSPVRLDDEGRCTLLFDDKLTVTLEPHRESGALVFFAEIGAVPADWENELYRKMLEANYFWQHTGGVGTLALTPSDDPNVPRTAMLLCQTPLQSLEFAAFQKRLSDFVETAEGWMDYLGDCERHTTSTNGHRPEVELGGPLMRV